MGFKDDMSRKKRQEEKEGQPTSTPLPSEELEPVQDHPENLINLLVQSVGSAITNRWGNVSLPLTEKEFQKFVENFHDQPFVVDVPRINGTVDGGFSLEDVISNVRKRNRSFRENDIIKSREDFWKYTKMAELMASDHFPHSREVSLVRMANYFSQTYERELGRLEEELLNLVGDRNEVDERTKQAIEERIEDLKSKERGIGFLIEARAKLLEEIKSQMRKRWEAVEELLDERFREALKKIGDMNVQGYNYKGVPREVWQFRQELTEALYKYRADLTQIANTGKPEELEKYFTNRYEDNPKYKKMIEVMKQGEGGYYLPYMTYFAGSLVMMEEYIQPVVDKYAESVKAWRRKVERDYSSLKEKSEYYLSISEVLHEALQHEDSEEFLRLLSSQGDRRGMVARALLDILQENKSTKKAKIMKIEGGEVKEGTRFVSLPPLEGCPDELREALVDVVSDINASSGFVVGEESEESLLEKIRDFASDRHNRVVFGIGGKRSEIETLGEILAVARETDEAVEAMRNAVHSLEGSFKLARLDPTEIESILSDIRLKFFSGSGKDVDRTRYEENLRAFYNLELIVEKLMRGQLTDENVESFLESPEFLLGEYIKKNFGRDAYNDVKNTLTSIARQNFKAKDVMPYYLSPEDYIRSVRDYVAISKIKEMVDEHGQGRYFNIGAFSFMKKKVLSALGLMSYHTSVKFEACVRQALYPDVSAMNYAPSHRLKNCMNELVSDLQRTGREYEEMSRSILNGNPLNFIISPLGIYLAFLSTYHKLSAKMAEAEIVKLDRELDKVVRERIISASSPEEMDKNVKDFFYDAMGIYVSVVPRHKLKDIERELKEESIGEAIKKLSKSEIKKIRKLIQEAGIADTRTDASVFSKIFAKKPSEWTRQDVKDFLRLMEKAEALYERHYSKLSTSTSIIGAEKWKEVPSREIGGAEQVSKVLEEASKEASRRLLGEDRGKPTDALRWKDIKRGKDKRIKEAPKESASMVVPLRKARMLKELISEISSIRQKAEKEFNSTTYTIASGENVFIMKVNPDKLSDAEKIALERMRQLMNDPNVPPQEKASLRKERENFFLRRLGLDEQSLVQSMEKGQIRNGLEYQHIFSKMMSATQYDIHFHSEGEGMAKRIPDIDEKVGVARRRGVSSLGL